MSRSSPRLSSSSCTVESLEQENVWLLRKLKHYEEQLHEGEETNNNLFLENQQLKEARNLMNSRVSDLSEELESLKCTISGRRLERDSLQAMYQKLEADVQRYKMEQEQALLTADETKSELEQAQEVIMRNSDQMSDLEEYISKLKCQIKTIQEESDKIQNENIRSSIEKDRAISELHSRISSLETTNSELAQQVSEGERADLIMELSQLDDSQQRESSPFDNNPGDDLESISLVIRKKDTEINDMKLRLESISLEREIAFCKHEERISELENDLEQAYLSLRHMSQSGSRAAATTGVSVQSLTVESEHVTVYCEAGCMTEMLMTTTFTQSDIAAVDDISCQTDAACDERKQTADVQVQCEAGSMFSQAKLETDSGTDGAGDRIDQLATMSPGRVFGTGDLFDRRLCDLCQDLLDSVERSDMSSLSTVSSEVHTVETVSIASQTDSTAEEIPIAVFREDVIRQITQINSNLSSASKALGILDSKLGPHGDTETGEHVERYQKSLFGHSRNTLLLPWDSGASDSKNNNNTMGVIGDSTYDSTSVTQKTSSQHGEQTAQQVTSKSSVSAMSRISTFWLVFAAIVMLVIIFPSLYTSFKRALVVKHTVIPPH